MLPFLTPVCDQHNTQHQTTSPVLSSAWSESLWLISWMNHCREVSVLPVTSSHIGKQTSGQFSWFVSSESFLYNQIKYDSQHQEIWFKVALYTCVWEVLGSSFGQDTDYPDRFLWFSTVRCEDSTSIRRSPSKPFPIHPSSHQQGYRVCRFWQNC